RKQTLDFAVSCSKGTYIRSLAHDFGKALGSGAHLSQLRRTAIGPYQVTGAQTPEEIKTLLCT
ncbi:MAG: tRNA pseudouridine(55) synthase, partial [Flavobacteriaceae bacterium]